jgi:hypothetical protein
MIFSLACLAPELSSSATMRCKSEIDYLRERVINETLLVPTKDTAFSPSQDHTQTPS